MKYNHTCHQCGKTFITIYPTSKYCGANVMLSHLAKSRIMDAVLSTFKDIDAFPSTENDCLSIATLCNCTLAGRSVVRRLSITKIKTSSTTRSVILNCSKTKVFIQTSIGTASPVILTRNVRGAERSNSDLLSPSAGLDIIRTPITPIAKTAKQNIPINVGKQTGRHASTAAQRLAAYARMVCVFDAIPISTIKLRENSPGSMCSHQ